MRLSQRFAFAVLKVVRETSEDRWGQPSDLKDIKIINVRVIDLTIFAFPDHRKTASPNSSIICTGTLWITSASSMCTISFPKIRDVAPKRVPNRYP
jgi:hypothetical protein